MQTPPGAPTSSLFAIRDTPHSGRAVFATSFIPADTLLLRADDLTLSVLLREYRREVCGQCFGYEYGRDLRIRDAAVGFSFCSEECQTAWRAEQSEIGVQAWTKVEGLVKGRSKEDDDMVDVDLPRPREKEIQESWAGAKAQASLIVVARQGERDRLQPSTNGANGAAPGVQVTKQHRKALQKALLQPVSPDVMTFCVSGLLWKYNKPTEWERVMALAKDATPYHNTPDLKAFVNAYLHLLAILPLPLLPLCTPETLFLLSSRDSHNSFGIRSLEDDGSEFFGYGCWPAASYFNHSCGPNVEKRRVGRVWEFRAAGEVEEGEELCITYLSGEERKLSRGKRAVVLKRNWGFACGCERCEGI
ncbi:SET domain-containing protein [Lophiostoma macrostomum CBS 122681]|uniref:SET domain-containing protein n=1 Tax=Lophiostoma macrostomum CBS 122681 TaxID=1314788 RepID=A0A6A6TAI7_9PLEO|nr:SET domain-containing protein [Lophiostoma macrostomum CBS 122681]